MLVLSYEKIVRDIQRQTETYRQGRSGGGTGSRSGGGTGSRSSQLRLRPVPRLRLRPATRPWSRCHAIAMPLTCYCHAMLESSCFSSAHRPVLCKRTIGSKLRMDIHEALAEYGHPDEYPHVLDVTRVRWWLPWEACIRYLVESTWQAWRQRAASGASITTASSSMWPWQLGSTRLLLRRALDPTQSS